MTKPFYITILFLLIAITVQSQSLKRYSTLLDRTDLDVWEKADSRSYDEAGIILNNGAYHPVGIIQYGLLCHYRYQQTKDTVYYNKMCNQVKFLKSDQLVDTLFDGKGVGLPYKMEYKGLKPPWYSGMAQGMGISFLLRYAVASGDTSIYPLVKKLAYVMLQRQEVGGCLSKTYEDILWIEEYPNSTQSPQVLNGFIFALFGLIEYCEFFPKDVRAARIRNECLASLKTMLPTYDSKKWTRYNKRLVYPNRVSYIRAQIFQMKQLYEITNDPFYLRQLCIWAAYIQDVPVQEPVDWANFESVNFVVSSTLFPDRIEPDVPAPIKLTEFEKNMVATGKVDAFPWYGYATSKVIYIDKKQTINISLDASASEVHIFYKYHWDLELFQNEKWQAKNAVTGNDKIFTLLPGYCQVAVFYKMRSTEDSLKVHHFGPTEE
jgi:hypothetical protein